MLLDEGELSVGDINDDGIVDNEEQQKLKDLQNMQLSRHEEQVAQISSWIAEIEGVTNMLNGVDVDSIQTLVATSEEGTILHEIFTRETKKVSKIAQEFASFGETLKGYIARKDDYKFRGR